VYYIRITGKRDAWNMSIHGRKAMVIGLVVVFVLAMGAQPIQAQGPVHVVRRGETLWSIATRYGSTVQAIAQVNGLSNSRLIHAGQRLTIPASGQAPGTGSTAASGATYTVRRGDTLSAIAVRYGTTISAIVRANGIANPRLIYAGQRLVIPGGRSSGGGASGGQASSSSTVYTVRRGDTVVAIAYRYGTTIGAIARSNGLANPSYIYPGQRLRIPGGGGAAPAPAPVTSGAKRIVVDLSAQRMYVYQNGQLLWNWVVSTGRPGRETAVGQYKVLNKFPNAYASTWGLQMPYWLGIYWAGRLQNGIHALPIQSNGQRLWEGYLGQRVSFGCIILSTQNAINLYNWAPVGTSVDVIW